LCPAGRGDAKWYGLKHEGNVIISFSTVYCHQIQSKQDLYKSLAEIGRWEALCENLGVKAAILNNLRFAQMEDEEKKRRCLQAFYKQGDVCWESVVEVVMDHPFYDRDLAKRIAKKYGVDLPKMQDNI